MPIFEYRCNKCGEDFEKLVSGNQTVKCPKCNSDDIKKKFSTFGMGGVEKTGSGSSGCGSCSSSSCSTCH
ncbi:MAG: hypothetical protein OHK0032_02930 [Thermodesulfovibrionales bacterium]